MTDSFSTDFQYWNNWTSKAIIYRYHQTYWIAISLYPNILVVNHTDRNTNRTLTWMRNRQQYQVLKNSLLSWLVIIEALSLQSKLNTLYSHTSQLYFQAKKSINFVACTLQQIPCRRSCLKNGAIMVIQIPQNWQYIIRVTFWNICGTKLEQQMIQQGKPKLAVNLAFLFFRWAAQAYSLAQCRTGIMLHWTQPGTSKALQCPPSYMSGACTCLAASWELWLRIERALQQHFRMSCLGLLCCLGGHWPSKTRPPVHQFPAMPGDYCGSSNMHPNATLTPARDVTCFRNTRQSPMW